MMSCTLCRASLQHKVDEEYFECGQCHGLLRNERLYLDRASEKAFYLTHENDVDDPRYQKFTAPAWGYVLEHFLPSHHGLDYGSGTGPVISKMLSDHGYQIAQYDPYFADDPAVLKQTYDYIVCCEVIEHFYNPRREFTRLKAMLKPQGQLICMTLLYRPGTDFAGWRYRKDPTHVFIYQYETIGFITQMLGFASFSVSEGRLVVWKS